MYYMKIYMIMVACLIEVISPAVYYVMSYVISTALCIYCIYTDGIPGTVYLLICSSNTILFIGIPMSICLHRYFAHRAFETGRIMHFLLGVIACLAFQGGPLQWAKMHKQHHILCDLPGDPHSAKQDGFWYAFIGWMANPNNYKSNGTEHIHINDCMKTWEMNMIQKLNPFPPLFLCYIVCYCFGDVFMTWTVLAPMILCRTITLLFNIEFHPSSKSHKCLAVDNDRILAKLVGESQHKKHHLHPTQAHRPDIDIPYWLTLHWMHSLGLIWNVK